MSTNDSYEVRCSAQMLPALLHGLAIARNTAMMSGRTGKLVQAEFEKMLEDLAIQCGIPNLLRVVDEYRWYKACDALKKAKEFHWYVKEGGCDWSKPDRPKLPGNLSLVVDDREYALEWSFADNTPHVEKIRELLEMYAAIDAVKKPDQSGWKSCEDMLKDKRERAEEAAKAASEEDVEVSGPKL